MTILRRFAAEVAPLALVGFGLVLSAAWAICLIGFAWALLGWLVR